MGATPDGRKAFTALSDNASPSMGRDTSGPTAAANSVAHLNQKVCHGGVLYNLRFDPRGVAGEAGKAIIGGVIKYYSYFLVPYIAAAAGFYLVFLHDLLYNNNMQLLTFCF